MITAIVQFDLPPEIDRAKAFEIFNRIAPLYREMDGLIHKYFCYSDEGKGAGNGPGIVHDFYQIDGVWKIVFWNHYPKT